MHRLETIEAIIIHHTTDEPGDRDHREYLADVREWHMRGRGFSDIGYHWLVFDDGDVTPGREECWTGAHCLGGWNRKSIGVALVGALHEHPPTPVQIDAAAELIARLVIEHGLRLGDVYGHHELWETQCPGRYCPPWMIRNKTRGALCRLAAHCLRGCASTAPRE